MKDNFLGSHSIEDWVFAAFLGFLGFLVLKLLKFNKNKTTGKFNFKYWIEDNIKEALLGFILFYSSFRFYDYIKVEFTKRIWETDLINDKFLYVIVISLSSSIIFERLRTRLKLSSKDK